MKTLSGSLTPVLLTVAVLVILSSIVMTRPTTNEVPLDTRPPAPSHRLAKRFVPATFIGPWVFNANFGNVWYFFSNPKSTPITSLGVNRQNAEILHDKALLAMSQTMEQYANDHPEVAARILADIREMAIMETGGSLHTEDVKEAHRVETQLYSFFQQHPELQDAVVEQFNKDIADFNLTAAGQTVDDPDGDNTNNDPPSDWAHAFSPPTPDADGLFT